MVSARPRARPSGGGPLGTHASLALGPNAREIEGWHFRNAANTGANDGSVNAPGKQRDFIFSPEVGRTIQYNGSATTEEDVARVEAFGRGTLRILRYRLSPPSGGERARFEWMKFAVCLTWPE